MNAAFAAGVTNLQTTLTENHTARLSFERDRSDKSFADKHGQALADRVLNYCCVTDEVNLPEIHSLLVKSPKNREYGILNSMLAERAVASTLPLTAANAPVATTRLIDDVFRSYQPGGTGLIFGQGLSPFAIVCEGHKEIADIRKLVKSAEMIESGSSLTLTDASTLTVGVRIESVWE
jgi:hypothetical protein